jgi:hypothetical protein
MQDLRNICEYNAETGLKGIWCEGVAESLDFITVLYFEQNATFCELELFLA